MAEPELTEAVWTNNSISSVLLDRETSTEYELAYWAEKLPLLEIGSSSQDFTIAVSKGRMFIITSPANSHKLQLASQDLDPGIDELFFENSSLSSLVIPYPDLSGRPESTLKAIFKSENFAGLGTSTQGLDYTIVLVSDLIVDKHSKLSLMVTEYTEAELYYIGVSEETKIDPKTGYTENHLETSIQPSSPYGLSNQLLVLGPPQAGTTTRIP